jgi:4'-phosphopantetheinyl transferase
MNSEFPSLYPLGKNKVHVWKIELGSLTPHFSPLLALLSEDELKRQERIQIQTKKFQFVITRGILRTLLGLYTRTPAQAIQLSYDSFGKPALTPPSSLNFNLSHSGDLALLALTQGSELGVDIERVRAMKNIFGIAERVFTPTENDLLSSFTSSEAQLDFFFRCWARKESLMKAMGTGFAYAHSCSLEIFNSEGVAQSSWTENGQKWSLHELLPDSRYRAALAVAAENREIENYSLKVLLERSSLW